MADVVKLVFGSAYEGGWVRQFVAGAEGTTKSAPVVDREVRYPRCGASVAVDLVDLALVLEVHEDFLRAAVAPVGDHLLERLAVADLQLLRALVFAERAQLHARHGLARRYCLLDLQFGVHCPIAFLEVVVV